MAPLGKRAGAELADDPLIAKLPNLARGGYRPTSPATSQYNCFAWAVERTDVWVDPYRPDGFWPVDLPEELTLTTVTGFYRRHGYEPCGASVLESGFEKIAIYADLSGIPTHAARQLESGRWTSKLGEYIDIEHVDPTALNGQEYGAPILYMRRRRPDRSWIAL